MLTNCHTDANYGRILNKPKRIPKFDAFGEARCAYVNKGWCLPIRTTDYTYNYIKVYEL